MDGARDEAARTTVAARALLVGAWLLAPTLALALPGCAARAAPRPLAADPRAAIACSRCAAWNAAREPFRVFGNTYWVGPAGLGAVLITSPRGHVLLDGGLPQSADGIERSVRALGFRVEDVKLLLGSHTHFDHAGGLAALQRDSGAEVAASAPSATALAAGAPTADDPQARTPRFPPVRGVRVVADGEVVAVGDLRLTAHLTPGHTPGGTTWTWRSCEGDRCLDVVYADSLGAVSDEGFRFTDPARPSLPAIFARSIATVAALPCDILLADHPEFAGIDNKRATQRRGGADAFVDPGACRAYAEGASKRLEERLALERAAPTP